MRFEGNTAIPETQQEEELIVKGKKRGREEGDIYKV